MEYVKKMDGMGARGGANPKEPDADHCQEETGRDNDTTGHCGREKP